MQNVTTQSVITIHGNLMCSQYMPNLIGLWNSQGENIALLCKKNA